MSNLISKTSTIAMEPIKRQLVSGTIAYSPFRVIRKLRRVRDLLNGALFRAIARLYVKQTYLSSAAFFWGSAGNHGK